MEIDKLKEEVGKNNHYRVEMLNLKNTIEEKTKAVATLNSLIEKLERYHDKNKLDIKSAFEKQNPDMKYTKFTKSFPKDDPVKKRDTDELYLAAKAVSDESIKKAKEAKDADVELKRIQKMRKDLRIEISNLSRKTAAIEKIFSPPEPTVLLPREVDSDDNDGLLDVAEDNEDDSSGEDVAPPPKKKKVG